MTEWISVKDRLPQAKEMVLAYEAAFDSMSMAFKMNDWRQTGGQKQWTSYLKATHWYAEE